MKHESDDYPQRSVRGRESSGNIENLYLASSLTYVLFNRPRRPKIHLRRSLRPRIARGQLLLARIVNGIETVHLRALDKRHRLRAPFPAAAGKRHLPVRRRRTVGREVVVPVAVGAHVADREVPDARHGVEVGDVAGFGDGGEEGGEIGGGLGGVIGESAGAVVLGAVG